VLVFTGDERPPGAARWVLALDEAGDAIATAIPGAERETHVGQGHVADPDAVAARLLRFFRARAVTRAIATGRATLRHGRHVGDGTSRP
jgi:hypothetical protein